jgi:hypothetical protein
MPQVLTVRQVPDGGAKAVNADRRFIEIVRAYSSLAGSMIPLDEITFPQE